VLGAGTYDSPRISSEIADCSMPMTFDHFNLCSKGCAYCVVEGTLISVPKREKKIELLNVGDPIYTKNIESNSVDIDIISSVMERTVGEVLEITLENGSSKFIKDIQIEDKVKNYFNQVSTVIDKFKYEVNEEIVELAVEKKPFKKPKVVEVEL